jgi:hypothetical protein
MKKGANNDEELYDNFWLNKWKCNHVDPKQWVENFFVVFFFFFFVRSDTIVNSIINITTTQTSKAKANHDIANNNSCAL